MICPLCKGKFNLGSALGHLGKGKKKKFSKAELKRRTERLREYTRQREAAAFSRMDLDKG